MKLGARAARAGGDMCCPERQLGACCGCVPLRAGALALAAFFLIFDLLSVVLFTLRYYDDPFEHQGKTARCLWGEHSVLWREMRSGMLPLLRFVQPFVVALLLFYVACGVVDMALLAAAILKSTVIMQIWVVLSLFRALHVFLDTFVVVVTCLYVNKCLHYVYPNIMSLVSLVVLLYARGVIASYAYDHKHRRRASRDEEGGPPPPAAKAPPSSGGFTTPDPGDARRSQSASSYEPAPSADKRASARLPATPKAQPDSAKPGKQLAEAPHTRQPGSPKPDGQPGSPKPKTERASPKPETKPGTGKSESTPGSDKSESKPGSVKSESKPVSVKSESKPVSVKSESKTASVKSDTEAVSVESETKPGPVKSKTEPGSLKFDKRQVLLKPDHEADSPLSERQLVAVKLDRLGGSPKLETLSDTDSTKTRSPSRALNRGISYVLYKMHSRSLSDASPVSSVIVQTVSGMDDRVITTTTPLKGSPLQLAFGVNVGGGAVSPSASRSQRSRSHHRQRSDAAHGREPQPLPPLAPLAARRQSRARRSRSPSATAASVYAPAAPDAPAGRLLGRTGGARVQKYPPPQRRAMPARKPRAPTKKRSMP